jgi:hypothetical protein
MEARMTDAQIPSSPPLSIRDVAAGWIIVGLLMLGAFFV